MRPSYHFVGTILFLIVSSLSLSLPAIAQQQQIPSSNILAAKLLNKYPLDNGNNNPLVNNNHLASITGPRDLQQLLKTTTVDDYLRAINKLLLDLRQAFITRSFKFDEHFRNLLSASKRGLHLMFTNTYGIIYEKNTEIFTEMYGSLEQYYDSGQVNLTKSMDDFFANLYKRVFQVYNSNKQFDNQYLDCVSDRLTEMKPFKDVPEKLIQSIRYTFVAARTFLRSLNEGIAVIKNVLSLGQPPQCLNLISDKLITKDLKASSLADAKPPCLEFCHQVIGRCIGIEQMDDNWRIYVASLSELALKLSTSYNIETIIEPLDVQISEAIMNFQENASNITERVYKICGGPVEPSLVHLNPFGSPTGGSSSGRARSTPPAPHHRLARRSANPMMSVDYDNRRVQQQQFSPRGAGGGGFLYPKTFTSASLDGGSGNNEFVASPSQRMLDQSGGSFSPLADRQRSSSALIDEIKKYASSSKSFWSSIPNSVCYNVLGSNATSSLVTSPPSPPLHNNNKQKPQSNCYTKSFAVADINSDIRYKTEISKQANHLRLVHSKIQDALNGIEVVWPSSNSEQQQLVLTQQSPVPKAPQVIPPSSTSNQLQVMGGGSSNVGSRPYSPLFTTSTTQPTSISDDSASLIGDDEEDDGQNINLEEGSGSGECNEEDPESCEETDPGADGETGSSEEEGTNNPPTSLPSPPPPDVVDSISTAMPDLIDDPTNNKIDQVSPEPDNLVLITAPNQNNAGFQRSGQTSYKLVINIGGQILLSLTMSVALLFVTNFSTRSRVISLQSR